MFWRNVGKNTKTENTNITHTSYNWLLISPNCEYHPCLTLVWPIALASSSLLVCCLCAQAINTYLRWTRCIWETWTPIRHEGHKAFFNYPLPSPGFPYQPLSLVGLQSVPRLLETIILQPSSEAVQSQMGVFIAAINPWTLTGWNSMWSVLG